MNKVQVSESLLGEYLDHERVPDGILSGNTLNTDVWICIGCQSLQLVSKVGDLYLGTQTRQARRRRLIRVYVLFRVTGVVNGRLVNLNP